MEDFDPTTYALLVSFGGLWLVFLLAGGIRLLRWYFRRRKNN